MISFGCAALGYVVEGIVRLARPAIVMHEWIGIGGEVALGLVGLDLKVRLEFAELEMKTGRDTRDALI